MHLVVSTKSQAAGAKLFLVCTPYWQSDVCWSRWATHRTDAGDKSYSNPCELFLPQDGQVEVTNRQLRNRFRVRITCCCAAVTSRVTQRALDQVNLLCDVIIGDPDLNSFYLNLRKSLNCHQRRNSFYLNPNPWIVTKGRKSRIGCIPNPFCVRIISSWREPVTQYNDKGLCFSRPNIQIVLP